MQRNTCQSITDMLLPAMMVTNRNEFINIGTASDKGGNFHVALHRIQEHPMSCSAKKLLYSGYFAGKIDPVLCVAGKMKYIGWETF